MPANLPSEPSDLEYHRRCELALVQALTRVEAYRSWRAFDPGPGVGLDARYAALPRLTKRLMNLHGYRALVPPGLSADEGLRDGEVVAVATSGTTEERIENLWYQPWWDASERASWKLHATAERVATGQHREALLASPLNVGTPSAEPLSFEQRSLGRFLYLNERVDPNAWPDAHYERILTELERFQPTVLEANPSLLSRLCRYALRRERAVYQPELIVLTFEYPSLIHRRHMAACFQAPLMSSYGTTESGYVMTECERGSLHPNRDQCRIDILPFREGEGGPSVGLLLVTTFANPWRSLLRFDTGDLVRIASVPCPCGRAEPPIASAIEGRATNLTLTSCGRPVTQSEVDSRLANVPGIDGYQLLQTAPGCFELAIECDGDGGGPGSGRTGSPGPVSGPHSVRTTRAARDTLLELYGEETQLEVRVKHSLAPEGSGKYRLVKALFPIDPLSFVAPTLRPPLPPELTEGNHQ